MNKVPNMNLPIRKIGDGIVRALDLVELPIGEEGFDLRLARHEKPLLGQGLVEIDAVSLGLDVNSSESISHESSNEGLDLPLDLGGFDLFSKYIEDVEFVLLHSEGGEHGEVILLFVGISSVSRDVFIVKFTR